MPGPDSLTDLQLWLRAESLALNDNDEISTWEDESGNNRDVTGVASPTLKPIYRATDGPTGGPAVRCATQSGGGGYFTVPNFLTSYTSGHAFVVVKSELDPVGQDQPCPLGDWGSAGISFFLWTSDGGIYDDFGTSVRKTTGNPTPNMASQFRVYENRSAAGAWSNWIDGGAHFSTGTNTVAWGTAPYIGRRAFDGRNFNGLICEIIFYNRVLSGGDLTTIYDYLEDKYGITLP